MYEETFTFEAEPFEFESEFELEGEGAFEFEEGEFPRRPAGPFRAPARRPPPRPRPRPRGPRWGYPPPFVPGAVVEPVPGCETVLVLEGFGAGQSGLATHHGPMLQRLASAISRLPQRPQSIQVDGRTAAGRPDRHAEAAARYLQTRFRGIPVSKLSTPTQGPERVEIRLCFGAQE